MEKIEAAKQHPEKMVDNKYVQIQTGTQIVKVKKNGRREKEEREVFKNIALDFGPHVILCTPVNIVYAHSSAYLGLMEELIILKLKQEGVSTTQAANPDKTLSVITVTSEMRNPIRTGQPPR